MNSRVALLGTGLVLLAAVPISASNGMNMIGFGPESVGMGGADLALTASPCSMNINPAGIARNRHAEFELGLSSMSPSLSHSDAMGNHRDDDLQRYPVPFIGYTRPLKKVSLGVGLFLQGGLGAEYKDLTTPFAVMAGSGAFPPGFFGASVVPAVDDTQTSIAHAKLTPTVAWRAGESWTFGAALHVSHIRAEMKLFPETSVLADLDGSGVTGDSPGDAFFGLNMRDSSSTGYSVRIGMQYTDGPFSFAGAYSSASSLDLDGGTMTMNLTAMGLGKVNYDASMIDFGWPQQAGVGVAYQFTPRFRLASDVDWVEWSAAIDTITIALENPDVTTAPPSRQIPFGMDWENQWVWALGATVQPTPDWAIRFGYNHGDTPIPATTLRPLFPAIAEDHVTAGFGVAKGDWAFDMAFEYVLETELINSSIDPMVNPFGPGSQESLSQFVAHFLMRRTLTAH